MMIGKFHKLIQSRILWAVFLVVIVFTFVIWGTQLPGERNRRTAETSPGLLDGKPVDAEDFQSAFAHTYAALYMMYGRELPNTTAFREKIRESAWERLVALRLADHLDIRVSDAEVLAMVQAQEGFKRDGRFDINLYRQQVSQALEPLGLGLRFFEEHVRQEIALQRLAELSSETYLLPPLDLHRMLATITDRFDLRMVAFGMDSVGPVPDPTREEILAYFARASERYRVPAKAKIRLVRFQADPDAADLSDPDSEDVQDFYEENRNRFWVAARQATETEEAQPARFRPLDEVRPELISAMRAEAARARALREAERFVGLIAPMQREAAALSFDEAAEKMKVIPADFGPFSAADGRETAGVSPAIVRAAMDLLPEEPVSSVIPDGNDAVALLVTERIPSRIPELDEVLDRVTLDAKQEAVQRTLIRRVEEFHSAAKQFGSVQQAAENAGLPVLPVEGFSATSSAKTDETIPAEALMSGILHLQNGAISDPVQNGNDGWIVAQVIRREPAPLSDVEALVPDVTGMLYRERSRQVFQDLQSYLLRPERFTNLRPAKPDEENEEI